ncbi:MAG TPA: response regulator [bacterium]|nr:response regulator [bacterium]
MSTAYGIVQRHRGHLSFKSKPGEGTTFYVKLMAALFVQQLAPDVARAKEVGPPKPLSVLVVDDDEAVRTTLVEMLEIQDHEVHQAGSGKEALRMIEERSFDIVFTDLGMPGMSGWEVSQEIKKRAPQTNIVMITGWGSQLDKEKAEQTGIQRILPKPVSFDEIVRAVTDFGLPLKS